MRFNHIAMEQAEGKSELPPILTRQATVY
jgi:hypothetical protein